MAAQAARSSQTGKARHTLIDRFYPPLPLGLISRLAAL